MTIRKNVILPASVAALAALSACNSSTYQNVEQTASAAVIRSFSLAADTKVLSGLDSVFFSIDLTTSRIFNADSLPKGTRVTALVPQITTLEGASAIQITFSRAAKADTTINYTGNSTDSVDFTNPVTVRVVSPDGLNERRYTVTVNVHTVAADSLAWSTEDSFALPTSLAAPTAQRTARAGSDLYVLTASGTTYCLARYEGVDNLGSRYLDELPLTKTAVNFSFTPQVETLAGTTDGTLYILDAAGALYRSTNRGASWAPTGLTWKSVIGPFSTDLLGVVAGAQGEHFAQNLSGATFAMPSAMPVCNFSTPVEYTFPMSAEPQLLVAGGRCADGSLSSDTWGFDGSTWARISRRGLPVALEGAAIAPYVVLRQVGVIKTAEQKAMIAFGGRDAEGNLNTVTYVSTDYGVNWRKADSTLQLPDYIPAMWKAQPFVLTTTLSGNISPRQTAPSRISRPIEEWDCPYIYIIGGCDGAGALYPKVWRGAINKLTFKPIV